MKICTKCKILKTDNNFYKDIRRSDGLMSACKSCHCLYSERQVQYKKDWYQENKQRLNQKQNLYNRNYRDISKPWMSHLFHVNQRCNNPNSGNYKWYGGRGIKTFLIQEEVKTLWFRDKAYLMKQPSIDREDSDGHYIFNNCRFIELVDNVKRMHKEYIRVKIKQWKKL